MSTALDSAAMSAAIDRLADQIFSAANGQAVDLVGIRSRGDEVAERVFAKLVERGAQARLGVLDISLYRDDYEHLSSNPTLQSSSIDFPVDGSHVVLVDDVIFKVFWCNRVCLKKSFVSIDIEFSIRFKIIKVLNFFLYSIVTRNNIKLISDSKKNLSFN